MVFNCLEPFKYEANQQAKLHQESRCTFSVGYIINTFKANIDID